VITRKIAAPAQVKSRNRDEKMEDLANPSGCAIEMIGCDKGEDAIGCGEQYENLERLRCVVAT
jgi:hypothetical protein